MLMDRFTLVHRVLTLTGCLFLCIWQNALCTSVYTPEMIRIMELDSYDTLNLLDSQPIDLANFINLAVDLKKDTAFENRLRGNLLLDCIARNAESGIAESSFNLDDSNFQQVLLLLSENQYHVYEPTPTGPEKFVHYLMGGKPSDYCHIVDALNGRILTLKDKGWYFLLLIPFVLIWIALAVGGYYFLRKKNKRWPGYLLLGCTVCALVATLAVHFPDFICNLIL